MARQEGIFPSITHLQLLMELYYRIKDFQRFDGSISHSAYNAKLLESLSKDLGISETSLNVASKLRGIAVKKQRKKETNDAKHIEGISPEILDGLAKIVIQNYSLESRITLKRIDFYWSAFANNLISLPIDIEKMQVGCKYYSELPREIQKHIDQFVMRKADELTTTGKDVKCYCAYFWNDIQRKVEVALISINNEKQYAIMEYIYLTNGKWKTKSIQRTDKESGLFKLEQSTLLLHLIEEGSEKKRVGTDLALATPDSEYIDLAFIKGTYIASRSNGTKPVAGVILLEKKDSYKEAYEALVSASVAPEIYFEIGQQRFLIDSEKITGFKDFKTNPIYKIIQQIAGIYIIGFFRKNRPGEDERINAITKGVCEIYGNGEVKFAVGNLAKDINGHIINTIFYTSDIIRISNYWVDSRKNDNFSSKYEYTLAIIRDKKSPDWPVTFLRGIYAGVEKTVPRSGEILFIKSSAYKSFDEAVRCEIPSDGYILMGENDHSGNNKIISEYFKLGNLYKRNYLIINTKKNKGLRTSP